MMRLKAQNYPLDVMRENMCQIARDKRGEEAIKQDMEAKLKAKV